MCRHESEAYIHMQIRGYDANLPMHPHHLLCYLPWLPVLPPLHIQDTYADTQTHLALLNSPKPALNIRISW